MKKLYLLIFSILLTNIVLGTIQKKNWIKKIEDLIYDYDLGKDIDIIKSSKYILKMELNKTDTVVFRIIENNEEYSLIQGMNNQALKILRKLDVKQFDKPISWNFEIKSRKNKIKIFNELDLNSFIEFDSLLISFPSQDWNNYSSFEIIKNKDGYTGVYKSSDLIKTVKIQEDSIQKFHQLLEILNIKSMAYSNIYRERPSSQNFWLRIKLKFKKYNFNLELSPSNNIYKNYLSYSEKIIKLFILPPSPARKN